MSDDLPNNAYIEKIRDYRNVSQTVFGGYHKAKRPDEDSELTHVGPNTPCGEYFRRFWIPVAMVDEVKDVPLRLKILGEDLVLFKDRRNCFGLLHLHCSHRNASLEFGVVEDRGLRCCYHGWLYDIDGTILETPAQNTKIKEKICENCRLRKSCGDLPGFCMLIYYVLIALVVAGLVYLLITMSL